MDMENRQGLAVDVKHLHGLAFTAAASRRWGGGEREGGSAECAWGLQSMYAHPPQLWTYGWIMTHMVQMVPDQLSSQTLPDSRPGPVQQLQLSFIYTRLSDDDDKNQLDFDSVKVDCLVLMILESEMKFSPHSNKLEI